MEGGDLIGEAIKNFKKALDDPASPHGCEGFQKLLKKYPNASWKGVKQLVEHGNIGKILHNLWKTQQQPQEAGISSIYEFVSKKLNAWPENDDPSAMFPSTEGNPLINLSAEIWFVEQLSRSGLEEYYSWSEKHNFYSRWREILDGTDNTFPAIVKAEDDKLLQALTGLGHVKRALIEFLESWEDVHKLTQHMLSRTLWRIPNEWSKKFHIIPKSDPSSSSEFLQMHGMHFYTTTFPGDSDNIKAQKARREAERLQEALTRYRFFCPPHDFTTFEQLIDWYENELPKIADNCSLFLMSFALHGTEGYMEDPSGKQKAIVDVLTPMLNPRLKEVPKVIILQVCRTIPPSESKQIYEKQRQDLKKLIDDSDNTMLLWAASKGELYEPGYQDTYIHRFITKLNAFNENDYPTLERAHKSAHSDDSDKAEKLTVVSKDNRRMHLLPKRSPSPTQQARDDADDDDEYANGLR